MMMAKGNGRLTAKSVGQWFSAKPYDEQAAVLSELHEIHDKVGEVKNQLTASPARRVGRCFEQRPHGAEGWQTRVDKRQSEGEIPRPEDWRHMVGSRAHGALAGREGEGRRETGQVPRLMVERVPLDNDAVLARIPMRPEWISDRNWGTGCLARAGQSVFIRGQPFPVIRTIARMISIGPPIRRDRMLRSTPIASVGSRRVGPLRKTTLISARR